MLHWKASTDQNGRLMMRSQEGYSVIQVTTGTPGKMSLLVVNMKTMKQEACLPEFMWDRAMAVASARYNHYDYLHRCMEELNYLVQEQLDHMEGKDFERPRKVRPSQVVAYKRFLRKYKTFHKAEAFLEADA